MESNPPQNVKREIAYKVNLSQIINGKYIKEEGWNPNKILLDDGRSVSRVNIIAVVVSSFGEGFKQLTIDDGTARISLRSFDDNNICKDVAVEDIIFLIGRPREYNNEKFIIPEIIKKVQDPEWVEVRKRELELISRVYKQKEKSEKSETKAKIENSYATEEISEYAVYDKMIEIIKKLDTGSGTNIDDIIKFSKVNNAEQIVTELIKRGEIFEIGRGRVKVLE